MPSRSSAASSLSVAAALVEALAADRRLVQDIGERLVPGAGEAERRCGGLDVGNARARRDQAQIGIANGRGRRGADAGRCVDDDKRHAVAVQRLQPLLDVAGHVNRLDDRLGIGTSGLPVREGTLRSRSRSGGRCVRPEWRRARCRWQACFCRSHPFGWPVRSSALMVLWSLFRGSVDTPHQVASHSCDAEQLCSLRLAQPDPKVWGIAVVRISNMAMMPEYKIVAIPYEYWPICAVMPSSAQEQQKEKQP